MKTKRLHLKDPYNVEVRVYSMGFDLIFSDWDKGEVVIHFEPWWVRYLAATLWKVVRYQESEVRGHRASLEGDDQ